MRDEKFLVLKWEDVHAMDDESQATLQDLCVDDAVVIRRQDVFAPPALEAYANVIMSAVEMMAPLLMLTDNPASDAMVEQVRDLRDIADYFHAQAQEAWLTARKIPDV